MPDEQNVQTPQRPNILFIMTDQQQWQTIAGRSLCRMPNVQRLVDGGMTFERSYTPSALCCPARAMLISGAFHWHNGVFNQVHSSPSVHRDMWPDVVTYSQRMHGAGYFLGYVGKWHASHVRTPLDFGFDEVAVPMGYSPRMLERTPVRPEDASPRGHNPDLRAVTPGRVFRWPGSNPFAMWQAMDGDESKATPAKIADAAIRMLGRVTAGDKPWHVEVHWQEPHDNYLPLKKYLDRYNPADMPVPASFYDTFGGKPNMHRRESSTWEPLTTHDFQDGLAHYFAYCEQLDAQIGRVLDALDASGQADNTMVVFTSDHGDLVGAHRMYIKGWMPYEECYRIPMVIRWPGHVPAGSRCNHLVQLHDLGHTYMDLLGLEKLPFADGRSLRPLLEQPDRADWRDEILCAYYGAEFLYTQRMIITERFKYVFNGFDFDEMYDLAEDPQELRNVADDPAYCRQANELRVKLMDMMTQAGDPYSTQSKYGARRYLSLPRSR